MADIPGEVRRLNPQLQYAPAFRLASQDGGKGVLIGGEVLDVFVMAPYPGWDGFKAQIEKVWGIARARGDELIGDVERLSIKYVNLLPADPASAALDTTNIKITLPGMNLAGRPLSFRTEMERDGTVIIVTANSPAEAQKAGQQTEGLILDIDIVRRGPFGHFWDEFPELLNEVHLAEKITFFELLAPETLKSYEPEY